MELLIVITIIGILIALLVPAVQAAREAARKAQCCNNLKQLGLAVFSYESQWSIFPPSAFTSPGGELGSYDASTRHESWGILVLPFLEQQALYDKFDRSKAITDSINETPRSEPLAVMLCPSDAYNRQPFMGRQGPDTQNFGDNWARGNYAANASLGFPYVNTVWCGWWGAGGPNTQGWANSNLRGVMGANLAIAFAQMRDGASNTVLLGEIRAGVTPYDPRGVWALSGACSSGLWAHGGIVGDGGYQMDDYGPNCPSLGADNVMNCIQIHNAFGGGYFPLVVAGMPCYGPEGSDEQTARSMHTGGVNTCFADGSIHWISDYIQAVPSALGRCPSGTG